MDQTAYIIARVDDATEHHGDRTLTIWDDDMHRTRSGALIHRDEQVDEDPERWRVFELRDVTDQPSDPSRCDCNDCAPAPN